MQWWLRLPTLGPPSRPRLVRTPCAGAAGPQMRCALPKSASGTALALKSRRGLPPLLPLKAGLRAGRRSGTPSWSRACPALRR
eukprot:12118072-Alexandrium_andersonii.AAC.1